MFPIKELLFQSSVPEAAKEGLCLSKVLTVDVALTHIFSSFLNVVILQCADPTTQKQTALSSGKYRGLPIVRPRGTLSMSEVNRGNRGRGEHRERQTGRQDVT